MMLKYFPTLTPILALLIEGEGFIIYFVAFVVGLGCMLMQQCGDIFYESK